MDGMNDINSSCPQCGHDNEPMGKLGLRFHYRCRDCGWVYSEADERGEVTTNPVEQRFPYDSEENLRLAHGAHAAGGPRGLWYFQHGEVGVKPATRLVEDCAIAFYTAYNLRRPGTF